MVNDDAGGLDYETDARVDFVAAVDGGYAFKLEELWAAPATFNFDVWTNR